MVDMQKCLLNFYFDSDNEMSVEARNMKFFIKKRLCIIFLQIMDEYWL
jgi:hypothetical protein